MNIDHIIKDIITSCLYAKNSIEECDIYGEKIVLNRSKENIDKLLKEHCNLK